MKIRVRDITSEGFQVQETFLPSEIGLLEDFVNLEFPLVVAGMFEKAGDVILGRVDLVFGLENHCARCLDRISRPENLKLELEFDLSPGTEYIDVGKRLREEIILGFSLRILCRPDCRGICPGCGADLNSEKCDCLKDK